MPNCRHCGQVIHGSWERFDKGVRLSDGTLIKRDVNLHPHCLVPWLEQHHPGVVPAT
jgi:hypothetical protein